VTLKLKLNYDDSCLQVTPLSGRTTTHFVFEFTVLLFCHLIHFYYNSLCLKVTTLLSSTWLGCTCSRETAPRDPQMAGRDKAATCLLHIL